MKFLSTLGRPVRVSGVGLHSGRRAEVVLTPAEPNHGIVFYRSDKDVFIPALAENAGHFDHATTLGERGGEVGTVEHLLSAATGAGVSNLLVEVDGPELPILDGSSTPWLAAFRQAGLVRQGPAAAFTPARPIVVTGAGGKRIELKPARELRVSYSIDFPNPVIGRQTLSLVISPENYARHVAPARTFGFLAEYETLKAHGLARGATAENCIVVGDDRVENGDLRFPDEFVRHKILDLLGDLALVGVPITGHIVATRGGHALHAALARRLREELAASGASMGSMESEALSYARPQTR
jgi:UDP-3-O-[3-hydroxymyristoyl] N-acetylglucosamine deacetylase